MKPEHLYYKEVNARDGDYYRRWAASVGPYMSQMIDRILISVEHEEQAYNSCNGILHMCTNQSKLRVDGIAKICVESNACRYTYFKKLLNKERDVPQNHYQKPSLPEHSNLRGKEEYK